MIMFPACAGMNRVVLPHPAQRPHVPRVRGDEPPQLLRGENS